MGLWEARQSVGLFVFLIEIFEHILGEGKLAML